MKIVLIGIVKNEEKIIKRCITSARNIVDAICITDTGSIDNTINIIERYADAFGIAYKTYRNQWKNFGYNRSLSFLNAQEFIKSKGWKLEETYGLLLDADMKLVISKDFDKNKLTSDEYMVLQESSSLAYLNTRLIKMSSDWKCDGVTHEFWKLNNDNNNNNSNTESCPIKLHKNVL